MTVMDQTQSKADEEFLNKNFKEAIRLYTELINKKADNLSEYYHKRAKCFYELRINKNGLTDAQAALDLKPNDTAIIETIIKTCVTLNDLESATNNMQKLRQIDAANAFVKKYDPKIKQLKPLNDELQKEMGLKNYQAALDNAEKCCELIDLNSFYKNEKIRIQIYLGSYEEAENEISNMLFASKVDIEAIQLRALLLWYKGKEILATRELELAEKLIKYLGGYQMTSTIAAKLHMQCHYLKYATNKLDANDYETALKFLKETINQDIHNGLIAKKAIYLQAVCYDRMDQVETAIEHCTKSLEYDPDYSDALQLQAECFKKMNKYGQAEQTYKKLLKTNEDNEKYKNYLKEVQQTKGGSSNTENKQEETDWEILGIKEDATLKQVQEAYKKMAKMHHTDQHVLKDDATKGANLKKMEQVNQAKANMEKRIKQKQKQNNIQPPIEIK